MWETIKDMTREIEIEDIKNNVLADKIKNLHEEKINDMGKVKNLTDFLYETKMVTERPSKTLKTYTQNDY